MILTGKATNLLAAALLAMTVFTTPALAVQFGSTYSVDISNLDLFRGSNLNESSDFFTTPKMTLRANQVGSGKVTISFAPTLNDDGKTDRTTGKVDYTIPLLVRNRRVDLSGGAVIYLNNNSPNTKELFVKARTYLPLRPTVTAYYGVEGTDRDGVFCTGELSHTAIFSNKLKARLGVLASYNQEAVAGYTGLHNTETSLAVEWTPMVGIQVTPHATYSLPLSDSAKGVGGLGNEISFGLKMAVNF